MGLYKMMARINIDKAIIRLLSDSKDGLNISMIQKETGVYIKKVRQVLIKLREQGKVTEDVIGSSKVYYSG